MYLSRTILGKSIVERLEHRASDPVLVIGADYFTRPQLSKIGCFNFLAAARLTHLLNVELKVKSTRDLFLNYGPQHLALPGLGAISLATVGAAFEVMKLGNLEDYVARHHHKGDHSVTFARMKVNVLDQQAAAAEKRDKKRRQRSRGRTAHELRVARHVERHATH